MEPGQPRPSSSRVDDEGLRIVRESQPSSRRWVLAPIAGLALLAWLMWRIGLAPSASVSGGSPAEPPPDERVQAMVETPAQPAPPRVNPDAQRPAMREPFEARQGPDDLPSEDSDDLAAYFSPGDPEPTAAEVIEALQASGDHTGLGAFNPPGTSPPLQGLAVPEDFALPPGYVRHHQVTDAGEPLEPILMYSPDYVFRDASGREIAIPEDRIVPPEDAPPGMPIRPITIPEP